MSEFQKLLTTFVDGEDERTARIDRSVQVLGCTFKEAIQLDDAVVKVVKASAAAMGMIIDGAADLNPAVRGSMMLTLPRAVAANFEELTTYMVAIAGMTTLRGEAIADPGSPGCDCNSCQLARAASILFHDADMEGDRRHAAQS